LKCMMMHELANFKFVYTYQLNRRYTILTLSRLPKRLVDNI